VTHVTTGLLQSNKSIYRETGIKGEQHLFATPNSAITKRTHLGFQLQQSAFKTVTFVVYDTTTTKKLFKDWTKMQIPSVGTQHAAHV
jgi:hypothetical protein